MRTRTIALISLLIFSFTGAETGYQFAAAKESGDDPVSSAVTELFVPSDQDIQQSTPIMPIPMVSPDSGSCGDVETITIPRKQRSPGTASGGDIEIIPGHDVETVTIPGGGLNTWQPQNNSTWSQPIDTQRSNWQPVSPLPQANSWQQWAEMADKVQSKPTSAPAWGPPQHPTPAWSPTPVTQPMFNGPAPAWGAPPIPPVTTAPPVTPLAPVASQAPSAAASASVAAPPTAPASNDLGSNLLSGFLNWAASTTKPAATVTPATPAGTQPSGSVLVPAITVPAITLPAITLPAITLPANIPGAIADSMKNMAPKTPAPAVTPQPVPASAAPLSGFTATPLSGANSAPGAGYTNPAAGFGAPGFVAPSPGYGMVPGAYQPSPAGTPQPPLASPPSIAGSPEDILDTELAESLLGPGGQRNLSSPNPVRRSRPAAPSLLDSVFSPSTNSMVNYLLGPRGLNTGIRLRLR